MNQTQTVIVYRNRAEADFWEGGYFVPLVGGLVSGLVTMLILSWIAGKLSRDWRGPNGLVVGASCIASVCVGILTFKYLFI